MTVAVVGVLVFLVTWASDLSPRGSCRTPVDSGALHAGHRLVRGHGIAVKKSIVETNFGSSWISGVVRGIGGHGYSLVTFLVIVFAFVVLGLAGGRDFCATNVERLENAT